MKRLAFISWVVLRIVLTVFVARHLTALYLTTPGNMPYCIDMAIRFGFRIFAHDDMPDPDMGDIALLICFACAFVMVGAIIGIAGALVWRHVLSQRLR